MYTMRKVKESKKDKKPKQKRIIKEKQKEKQREKQQISIVINSNNRNKKTSSAPKQSQQPQPMPQQSRISNNPPVVNVMGDTRPQVSASGNFSGLGQQNRIFAADSGLEQRLARLQKWENDSSSNPSPVRSNEKILIKQEKEDKKEIIKAPDSYKREDYNFFSPSRSVASEEKEQSNDDVSVFDNDDETEVNSMDTNDNLVGNSEPPDYEPPSQSLKDKFISLFTPKRNELDNVAPLSASSLSQLNRNTESEAEYAELRKPWKDMKRDEKRQWAVENMGNQQGYVSESAAVINKMLVGDLNGLHSKIESERKVVKSKRI